MRKLSLVLISFMLLSLLAGCGKNLDNGDNLGTTSDNQVNKDTLEDLVEKTPLTIEDLDRINKNRFPVSYTYSVYDGETVVETGEYIYSKTVDHNILLPIEETMENRKIISSVMSHDRINTTVDITLKNGESYPILYIIDPDTLEYLGASLSTPNATTLYTFSY